LFEPVLRHPKLAFGSNSGVPASGQAQTTREPLYHKKPSIRWFVSPNLSSR
jgi:hypothetical protein